MSSPPTKRIKLEPSDPSIPPDYASEPPLSEDNAHEEEDAEHCSICLQPYADRAMIPTCSHEFCFECLLIWTGVWLARTISASHYSARIP